MDDAALAREIETRMRAYCASQAGSDDERRQAIALADVIGRNEKVILTALRNQGEAKPEASDATLRMAEHLGTEWVASPRWRKAKPEAVEVGKVVESIVVAFSDCAILKLDIDENDARLARICDAMRGVVRSNIATLTTAKPEAVELLSRVHEALRKTGKVGFPLCWDIDAYLSSLKGDGE